MAYGLATSDQPSAQAAAIDLIHNTLALRTANGFFTFGDDAILGDPAYDGLDTAESPTAAVVLIDAMLSVWPHAAEHHAHWQQIITECITAHSGLLSAAPLAAASWARVTGEAKKRGWI